MTVFAAYLNLVEKKYLEKKALRTDHAVEMIDETVSVEV